MFERDKYKYKDKHKYKYEDKHKCWETDCQVHQCSVASSGGLNVEM